MFMMLKALVIEMTLQPALQGLIVAGKLDAPHTLEAFCKHHSHFFPDSH